MHIVDVKLEEREVDPKYGVPEDYTSFLITDKDPDDPDAVEQYLRASNDPRTELYQLVHEWYKKQKVKPFKFKFKNPPKE